MLPSTNNICLWRKQESVHFNRVALRLWAVDSVLDKIHDENAASIEPQNLTNRNEISQKW